MTGETLALLAALAYGVASVTIVKGKAAARGDNGVFLSVVATAILTWMLWFGWGSVGAWQLAEPRNLGALAVFACAGLFSTVLGRATMYRATEQIGAVRASLLRRLTPAFALVCAYLLLDEAPETRAFVGGGIILIGVLCYRARPASPQDGIMGPGLLLGIGSAFFYALAYTLRSLGLDSLPDAALGTFAGAIVGVVWFMIAAAIRHGAGKGLLFLLRDRGPWHWATALSLSAGQTLQFFALKTAPVSVVAVLGTMEVFFSALLVMGFLRAEPVSRGSLGIAAGLAALGTAILFT